MGISCRDALFSYQSPLVVCPSSIFSATVWRKHIPILKVSSVLQETKRTMSNLWNKLQIMPLFQLFVTAVCVLFLFYIGVFL